MTKNHLSILEYLQSHLNGTLSIDDITHMNYPTLISKLLKFKLKTTFLRPVWQSKLIAHAYSTHKGKTITHYCCEIKNEDDKPVAVIHSAVMTLRGEKAVGREDNLNS